MSSQPNAWQTARGNRNSSSRTPQTRSGTASPSQPNAPSQPPPSARPQETKHQAPAPAPSGNVWAQRSAQQSAAAASSAGSNGPPPAALLLPEEPCVNGFNSAEVRAFLSREPAPPAAYKPQDGPGSNSRASGGVWGAKTNHMASGQPFFVQLSKQVAAFQEGG